MKTIRTFVAVEVSSAVLSRAADLTNRLRSSGAEVKWVPPQHIHLTLKFLGDVPDVETPNVCRAVAEAAAKIAPFEIVFRGAGAFPSVNRPRTVWIGVERGEQEVAALHKATNAALAKVGFPKERRRFQPHLTIGRVRRGGPEQRELGRLIQEHADFQLATAHVSEVVVFASYLDKAGPTYKALGRGALGE